MKNLFSYATKELSQDAFLRWFLESYDDEEVGYIVADFINYFTVDKIEEDVSKKKPPLNLTIDDITKIETKSQAVAAGKTNIKGKIDISVDVYSSLYKDKRVIVIEDKTTSEEHNQLGEYNEILKTWKCNDAHTYKVFYKTNRISGDERNRVISEGWHCFDIEDIYNFFIKYKSKTNIDILNDYIDHIEFIYNELTVDSSEPLSKWNDTNYDTFMRNYINKEYGDIAEYGGFSYQNKYYSFCIYVYNLRGKRNKYLYYSILEIIKRGNELKPYLHPGYKVQVDNKIKWEWSLNKDYFNDEVKRVGEKETIELREFVQSQNSNLIKRANTSRAFGKIDKIIDLNKIKCNNPIKEKEELKKKLNDWINPYIELIKEFKK